MRRGARGLAYGGTAAIVLLLAELHAKYIGNYQLVSSSRLVWTIAYIGLLCTSAYAMGLPDTTPKLKLSLGAAIASTIVAATGISLIQLAAGSALLPRFVVFWSLGFLIPWYSICANVAVTVRQRQEDREKIILVADVNETEALRADLAASPERLASIVAALSVESARSGPLQQKPLIRAVEGTEGSVVVLDLAAQGDASVVAQAAELHERGVRIRTLSLFYEQWLGKLPLAELERVSLMFDIGEVHRMLYGRQKRVVDVCIALAGLVLLALVTPFVLLGNVIANRGPLLYRQRRVGKNSEPFIILKFRTMVSPLGDAQWTAKNDSRVTQFGKVLRESHLDELPQVWNILKGDLSIVGPRPEQPSYVLDLKEKIAFYDLRHLVRPGLTGWAQVKYAYGSSVSDAVEKLQYEFFYLRNQGLILDLRIIGRTLRTVFRRSGR